MRRPPASPRLGDLALFGGAPAFAERLHVGRPNIGDRAMLMGRIDAILDSRWLTNNGRNVQELESCVAQIAGTQYAVAVCNATVALEILARALGLRGEAIVPGFTFVASAHSLMWMGIRPRFADVHADSHLVDPAAVAALVNARTSAIMGVHLWGKPCDVEALAEIAQRRRVRLIYDAAHAFGCSADGTRIGQFGDASVFSFHATKFVNTFEGGAIVTNDGELARRARLMANFGFLGYDDVGDVGTNGKMNEVCAAMGLVSIASMATFVATNRRNHESYVAGLAGIDGLSLLAYNERHTPNYQYVVVEVDPNVAALHRDVLLAVLWAENVIARRYFHPGVHRMEPYRTLTPALRLPVTERIADRILVLPTGTTVDGNAIDRICGIIRSALEHADAVRERVRRRA